MGNEETPRMQQAKEIEAARATLRVRQFILNRIPESAEAEQLRDFAARRLMQLLGGTVR